MVASHATLLSYVFPEHIRFLLASDVSIWKSVLRLRCRTSFSLVSLFFFLTVSWPFLFLDLSNAKFGGKNQVLDNQGLGIFKDAPTIIFGTLYIFDLLFEFDIGTTPTSFVDYRLSLAASLSTSDPCFSGIFDAQVRTSIIPGLIR